MKILSLAACMAALLPPLAGAAADPADPEAPAPGPQYRSVFEATPAGVEQRQQDWRRANAEVGQFRRGHIDLLKWEEAQSAAPAPPARDAASAPAAPAARPPMPMHQHMHTPGPQGGRR